MGIRGRQHRHKLHKVAVNREDVLIAGAHELEHDRASLRLPTEVLLLLLLEPKSRERITGFKI